MRELSRKLLTITFLPQTHQFCAKLVHMYASKTTYLEVQINAYYMKWIRTTKSLTAVQAYNLVEGKITRETLRYHPVQQSARLNCNGEQRVFFIDLRGVRSNQFTIRNEYGFQEASIQVENNDPNKESGIILYEQHKIEFSFFHNRPVSELVIYDLGGIKPMATCSLHMDLDANEAPLFINKSFRGLYASLIWGLYWCTISAGNEPIADPYLKGSLLPGLIPVFEN